MKATEILTVSYLQANKLLAMSLENVLVDGNKYKTVLSTPCYLQGTPILWVNGDMDNRCVELKKEYIYTLKATEEGAYIAFNDIIIKIDIEGYIIDFVLGNIQKRGRKVISNTLYPSYRTDVFLYRQGNNIIANEGGYETQLHYSIKNIKDVIRYYEAKSESNYTIYIVYTKIA